jgi:hypothetical protein
MHRVIEYEWSVAGPFLHYPDGNLDRTGKNAAAPRSDCDTDFSDEVIMDFRLCRHCWMLRQEPLVYREDRFGCHGLAIRYEAPQETLHKLVEPGRDSFCKRWTQGKTAS